MVNTAYLNEIINALHLFFMSVTGFISLFLGYQAFVRLRWASELGGMNSMGTKSFTADAMWCLFGACLAGSISWLVSSLGGDLLGVQETTWVPLQDSDSTRRYLGDLTLSFFELFGILLLIKAALGVSKLGEGQTTFGQILWLIGIALMFTQMEWLNDQIATLTPLNPLGFFYAETGPVISM